MEDKNKPTMQLEERLRLFSEAVESAIDGFQIVDLNGLILYSNHAVEETYGFTPEELQGKHVREMNVDPWIADRVILPAIEKTGRWEGELVVRHKDGSHFPIWLRASLIRDAGGGPIAMVGIIRDIKERKKMCDDRMKFQHLESVGLLAGGISHDFNNILSIILNNMELARMKANENVAGYIEKTINAVHRGQKLIKNIMSFSSDANLDREPVNIGKLTEETIFLMKKDSDSKINVAFDAMPSLWAIYGNPGQLQQVLLNLYQNAVEAVITQRLKEPEPRESAISFRVDNVEIPRRRAKDDDGAATGEVVRLTAMDNGCGMDELTVSHIFEPFFSTKSKGNRGIGLFTVYGIVRQHGGWIDVESVPDAGTVIRIYFPRYEVNSAALQTQAPDGLPGGSETILVVEDEESLVDVMKEMLEYLGYKVFVSYSGEEALSFFSENSEKIDIVIADLIMPGMSGVELLDKIKAIKPDIRMIISSGDHGKSRSKNFPEGLKGSFLSKPFDFNTLAAIVRETLGRKKGSDSIKQHINKVKLYCVKEDTIPHKEKITDTGMVYDLFKHLSYEPREKFIAVYLDSNNSIIAYDELAQGTQNEVFVYPQEVLKAALLTNASSIILVHNHPSGLTDPSPQDLEITSSIIQACKIFNIKLLDHVIIGKDGYFSFSAEDPEESDNIK